jgi:hypothetical protein
MCLNGTYSEVLFGIYLTNSFPIKYGLKQGDALSSLLFNYALERTIRKVLEHKVGTKFNGTHQLLSHGDNVSLLGHNIDTINKNTETLTGASKKADLEINIEKTKYI